MTQKEFINVNQIYSNLGTSYTSLGNKLVEQNVSRAVQTYNWGIAAFS